MKGTMTRARRAVRRRLSCPLPRVRPRHGTKSMYRPSKPGGRAFLSMPTQRIGPTNEIKIRHVASENENDRNMHAYSRRHIYTHICIDQCNTSVFRAWPRFIRASSTSPAHGRAVCMATARHVESARGTRGQMHGDDDSVGVDGWCVWCLTTTISICRGYSKASRR